MFKLLLKATLKICVSDKHKRKNLFKCISKVGVRGYFKLLNLGKLDTEENRSYKHFMSLVAIVKNEGPYLREWIEYHRLIGVDHFYIYDNESEDDIKEVLAPYIENGIVTYTFFPGPDMQESAYIDAVKRFKFETRWMMVLDLDEYFVIHQKKNMREFMEDYKDCAQLSARWVGYGSSGYKEAPKGILEHFKAHMKNPCFSPKSIFNPRVTVDCGAHYMYVCGKWIDENHNEFKDSNVPTVKFCQVNHYIIKSWEEFYRRKAPRGHPDYKTFGDDIREFFNQHDYNDVSDDLMMPYVEKLKQKGVLD